MPLNGKNALDFSNAEYSEIRMRKYKGTQLSAHFAEFKAELDDCYWGYEQGANFINGWLQGESRPFYGIWDVQQTEAESTALYRLLSGMISTAHEFVLWQEASVYYPSLIFDLELIETDRQLLLSFQANNPSEFAQIESWAKSLGLLFTLDVVVQ